MIQWTWLRCYRNYCTISVITILSVSIKLNYCLIQTATTAHYQDQDIYFRCCFDSKQGMSCFVYTTHPHFMLSIPKEALKENLKRNKQTLDGENQALGSYYQRTTEDIERKAAMCVRLHFHSHSIRKCDFCWAKYFCDCIGGLMWLLLRTRKNIPLASERVNLVHVWCLKIAHLRLCG